VNPFLFMTATLVEVDHDEHGMYKPIPGVQIIGQNVSSLHRLKDIDNKGEQLRHSTSPNYQPWSNFTRQMVDSSCLATYHAVNWVLTGYSSICLTSTSEWRSDRSDSFHI
jgi:hypothetical protein